MGPIVGIVVLRAMGAMLMFSRSVALRTMRSRLVLMLSAAMVGPLGASLPSAGAMKLSIIVATGSRTLAACGVSRPKIGLGRGCTVALPVYLKTKVRLGRNVPIKIWKPVVQFWQRCLVVECQDSLGSC